MAGRGDETMLNELTLVNNELANVQRELAAQNLLLARLNEEKNRLLGMAAHDLRTPIGVIRTYSEFLEEEIADNLTSEQKSFLSVIHSSSEFMLRLIDDLLDVSAIEAGRLSLQREPADLEKLIRRSVEMNHALGAHKRIGVEFLSPGCPVIAPVDSGKIEQVLNNLISNAIKFSHPDTTVHVALGSDDGNEVVRVEDQGQGIPAEELNRLFDPFVTSSVRATAGESSTGLGLAIVRRIIEGHGGTVGVRSEVGRGSVFSFTLPGMAA